MLIVLWRRVILFQPGSAFSPEWLGERIGAHCRAKLYGVAPHGKTLLDAIVTRSTRGVVRCFSLEAFNHRIKVV